MVDDIEEDMADDIANGMADGIANGMADGIANGMADGIAALLTRDVRARYDTVNDLIMTELADICLSALPDVSLFVDRTT